MGIAVILALCGLIAQAPVDESGRVAYTVRVKSQSEPLHVLAYPAEVEGLSFVVEIDEPWRTDLVPRRIQRSELEADGIEPELPALRADRWRRGWLGHGGVLVRTRSDGEMWVLETEKGWADKAQSLARAAYAPEADTALGSEALPEAKSDAGPGIALLWAPHAAIAAAAIALAAGVFFVLLRPRERWQPLDSGNSTPRKR